jgi:hypothetical protein
MDQFDVNNAARTPLSGFLIGLLMGFDSSRAADIRASYRVKVDERTFDFSNWASAFTDSTISKPTPARQNRDPTT